jgi:ABC-type phosphate/phosphonate transport system permease subunit
MLTQMMFLVVLVLGLNSLSFRLLNNMNADPDYLNQFSKGVIQCARVPPLALLITLFLTMLGFCLIAFEFLNPKKQ